MIRTRTLLLFFLLLVPTGVAAQRPPGAWNSERALELVQRAQQRRLETQADSGLHSYRADARAYVYFYLDRPNGGERNLVKTDQIALDVLWQAPNRTKQTIVGWRDQKSLPTNIHYHLDHLAVVMENFGDEIRIGDGDEVQDVPHPASPIAARYYDYHLADSLTLRLPGAPEPVRVYELKVRPKDLSQPGIIGSIFVERRKGDLVRLDFTFTPAAYRDRYIDQITISLDNGLWQGRYWLPNQQRVEVRREIPEIDIPLGSVIRGVMRVGNYRFNEPIPAGAFAGAPVSVMPPSARKAFPFEQGLMEELRAEGIGPEAELGEVRRQALALARERGLSGLGDVRLRPGRASDVVRYNRAEALALGAGLSLAITPSLEATLNGGWAFGPDHPWARTALQLGSGTGSTTLKAYGNIPRSVGLHPASSGVLQSLGGILTGDDYLDPFYASGAELSLRRPLSPRWGWFAEARVEAQRSAAQETDFSLFGGSGAFRPVHAIDEGTLWGGTLGVRRLAAAESGAWWSAEARADAGVLSAGTIGGPGFVRPVVSLGGGRRWETGVELEADLVTGMAFGELPRQELFLLGGKGTLPGYPFHSLGGERFVLSRATASAELWRPWLRGRLVGAAGWVGQGEGGAVERWGVLDSGARASLGAGIGLFHDILHVDLVRGLGPGGEWQVIVETQRAFWDFL